MERCLFYYTCRKSGGTLATRVVVGVLCAGGLGRVARALGAGDEAARTERPEDYKPRACVLMSYRASETTYKSYIRVYKSTSNC